MNIGFESILLFLAFFIPLQHSSLVASTDTGYISIDCGAEEAYTDGNNNIWYQTDSGFVESGQNHKLSSAFGFDEPQMSKQLNTVRIFPDGVRNCYTLTPKQGKNNKYLVRAFFAYRNYDLKHTPPSFDVYLGVNYWETIEFGDPYIYFPIEVIHVALSDTISVCLVNIGKGVPFISSLELWLLSDSTYRISSSFPLHLLTRSTFGMSKDTLFMRFEDDVYDRVWFNRKVGNSKTISTSESIDSNGIENTNKLPTQVMKTAIQSLSLSSSLEIYLDNYTDSSYMYYINLYFFEFDQQERTQKRIMDITFNDKSILTEPFTPPHLKLVTIVQNITQADHIRILIKPTPESGLPAMINAFEVYRVLSLTDSETYQEDVYAIQSIKQIYEIPIMNWQGDPCIPNSFAWEGLTCSSDSNPRIISLNLSSRGLTGSIDVSFSRFTKLQSLDLSYNKLTGEVPEFLAKLTNLKFINLSGNQLKGSIPKSLLLKSNTTLSLRLEKNPGLCLAGSCKANKFFVPLIAPIAASVAVLVLIVLFFMIIQRIKRKKGASKKYWKKKSNKYIYSSRDVIRITNNFKTKIGKGEFGEVYLGTLQDGRDVAVKLLSQTSRQGYKEFHSEADLLTFVHHKNLVSFVGYCEECDVKALIYEYMAKGNLQQLLLDTSATVLKWFERLQIAVDVALGLDYLHYGIRPPIVHRDLKTSNILLNENVQAKISDFGLCRSFENEHDSHITTRPAGTIGYLDPELHGSRKLNRKSDVYSFGIILLELISGQPAMKEVSLGIKRQLLDWVNPILNNGDIESIVDPRLEGQYNRISAWKLIEIAMACTQPTAIQRPDISEVVMQLKDCLALEITHEKSENSMRRSDDISSSDTSSLNPSHFDSSSSSGLHAR